jgi:hypothetical protein
MYTLRGKTWSIWHIRFSRQSVYASYGRSPYMTTFQPGWVVRETHLSFSPNTTIEAVRLRQTSVDEEATRLTGSISLACDQYIQYLLAGVNSSVLNRHSRGLQPWRCRLVTHQSLILPIDDLYFSPKCPTRSQVIQYQYNLLAILRVST